MSQTVRAFSLRRWWLPVGLLVIAAAFFCLCVATARHLLLTGYLFPNDIFFGLDVAREISNMAEPGKNLRSNVHPLFTALTKPVGLLLQEFGVTRHMAAVLMGAAAGAGGLLAAGWYFHQRRLARFEVCLAVLLLASTATVVFESVLPGTFMFSMATIALLHGLLAWTLRRPPRSLRPAVRRTRAGLWLLTGVVAYGITVSNGVFAFLAHGFAGRGGPRGWTRSAGYGALVLALGLGLTWCFGSLFNLHVEARWLSDSAFKGRSLGHPLIMSLSAALGWSVVAPQPHLVPHISGRTMATICAWDYSPGAWLLVGCWLVLLLGALAAALRERSPYGRRLTLALLPPLLFHVLLHVYYVTGYEGPFLYSGHSIFFVVAWLVPLLGRIGRLRRPWRIAARVALLAFALALAARHVHMIATLPDRLPLPPGFGPVG